MKLWLFLFLSARKYIVLIKKKEKTIRSFTKTLCKSQDKNKTIGNANRSKLSDLVVLGEKKLYSRPICSEPTHNSNIVRAGNLHSRLQKEVYKRVDMIANFS